MGFFIPLALTVMASSVYQLMVQTFSLRLCLPFSSLSPDPHWGHSPQNSKNKWHLLKMPTRSPLVSAKIKGKPLRKEFEFLVQGTLSFNFFKSLELMILNLLDPSPPFITSIWSHLLYYPEMKFKDNPLLSITFRKDSFI